MRTLLLRIAALVVAMVCVGAAAFAQTGAPVITGRVLAADADTPLRRARILVAAGARRAREIGEA